ncbi:MAG TPA: amidohydrolase family protein [Thermoanaerobaculia bacterium]|nr:amidohydrolase family protein [Thermoanaerobaculia bacterium]
MRTLLFATTVFCGATLIDGTGAPPIPDALLIVTDGRVAFAGPYSPQALAQAPKEAERIDVSGRWIIPGLIDAHVHAGSADEQRSFLRWGVTTARLMAEDVEAARDRARRSQRPAAFVAELVPAAPIFTAPGGWWDRGEPHDERLNRTPNSPSEAVEAVREARRLGTVEIKLMLDDMSWCRTPKPALPRLPAPTARALIEEARRLGLRASVHAPQLSDAVEAIGDGCTALAHGVLEPIPAQVVEVMRTRPVYYIPTLGIFELLADPRAFMDRVLADPRVANGILEWALREYRAPSYEETYHRRYPNYASVGQHLPALRENLLRLHRAGVPIALGTDMWAFPGLGVSIEMDLYVRAGLTPLEALRAATQTAARSLDLEADRGTLEKGKRADFLVLDADPSKDVTNVRSLREIYRSGHRFGPVDPNQPFLP